MPEHGSCPQRRVEGLVVQQLGDELLVYDREQDVAHCLGPVAARVLECCDGQTDPATIARMLTDAGERAGDLVRDALVELGKKGLLTQSPASDLVAGAPGISRRSAVRRMAGVAVSAPLIVSVMAPTAAMAASPTCRTAGQSCTGGTCRGTCCPASNLRCSSATSGTCVACIPVGSGSCTADSQCCSNKCNTGANLCQAASGSGACSLPL